MQKRPALSETSKLKASRLAARGLSSTLPRPVKNPILAFCAALSLALFVADLLVPLGVAAGVPYIVVVLAASWSRMPKAAIGFATLATALIGAGWVLSTTGGNPDHVLTNRALTVAVLWIVTVMGVVRVRAEGERIRARDQIQVDRSRLELALSAVSIGRWEWNVESDVVQWDAQSRRLFGVTREGPIASEDFFAHVYAEDRPHLKERVEEILCSGGEWDEEFRVVLPNGTVRWILGRGAALPRQKRVVGVNLDISDRKGAEARKDAFVAMLAHELRNPLNPLRTVAELLDEGGSEELERARRIIKRQVAHMARVLDDVLDASRLKQGKLTLHRKLLSIVEVVTQSVDQVRPKIEQKRHRLQVTLPSDPCYVEGDRVRLIQIVSNLLDNAIKYTEPEGRIALTVESSAELCAIRVKDSGRGIALDLLPRIFDPFAQDRSLEEAEGGLGLGLNLVSRLVALHGGRVQALSLGPGKGAEFVVRLPRAEREQRSADAHVDAAPEGRSRYERVLVIDDHEDSAQSLALWLEREGFAVRVAGDGDSGLKVAAEFKPDVVILDIGLPDISGYEVASHLRAFPGSERPALIITLSGYGGVEATEAALEAGADRHLLKPVNLPDLRQMLD